MSTQRLSTKTVLYRRCLIAPKPSQSFQQLLSAALASSKPSARYEAVNTSATEVRVIGNHKVINGCLCGYMTTFEKGGTQPVIGDDPTATALRLDALAPPKPSKGTAQQQYVPGIVYFAISNNHVALVQSMATRASAFEAHANWLLKSWSKALPGSHSFVLSDEAQKATKEKIKKSHVKSISFGQPLMSEVTVPAPKAPATTKRGKHPKQLKKFQPSGTMLDLMRGLFMGEEERFEKLGLDEVFDGNLEVWVEIRYPKYKRSKPEDAMKLMDTLGVALRDVEGDQVSLKLANNMKVTGRELKISSTIEVPTMANKLPDEAELWKEMSSWLALQIHNGVIDP